jgi:ApaG protein
LIGILTETFIKQREKLADVLKKFASVAYEILLSEFNGLSPTLFQAKPCFKGLQQSGDEMEKQKQDSEQIFPYSDTTRDIRVSVRPQHVEGNSEPENDVYTFVYTVRIENMGTESVQLLERHWLILSNGVRIAEVVGPGVVGVQPTLAPGGLHEYTSSAVIQDPVGSMEGSYTFKTEGGKYFDVKIPKFDLLYPIMLH